MSCSSLAAVGADRADVCVMAAVWGGQPVDFNGTHTHTLRQTHTLWTVDAWGGKAPTATMVPYHTFIFNLTHPQTAVTCVYALKTSTLCVCLIFYPSSVWLSMLCSQKQTVFCKRANSSQLTASHFRSFYATSHKKKSVSLFESIFYMEMDFIVCL